MTPAARIQAQIEVLDLILAGRSPADRVLGDYTRARRYMGSKDRRAILDGVYLILRHRARLTWWCRLVSEISSDNRSLVLAAQVLIEGRGEPEVEALFDGAGYHPAPLDESERALVAALMGRALEDPRQGTATRLELPDWLLPRLEAAFGSGLEEEMAALNREAPTDLRVNTLKADRETARAALAAEGIEPTPHPFAPHALRLTGRAPLQGSRAFRDGLIEIQDAGSQVAARLCDARPGMAVADFCAGAGGKTLALAAAMENRGRLVALDIDQPRLDRAAARLRRAGVTIAERQVLHGETWVRAQGGGFDRVLIDAPCSGTGAWRRDPYARWQLSPERLAQYHTAQADSLKLAARLVRLGGRLAYVTCSLLPEENEVRIEEFLAAHGEFTVVPAPQVWDETLGADGMRPPAPAPFRGPYLRLTPAQHDTDGFFAAILTRGPDGGGSA